MQPIHFATMANHADVVEMLADNYGVDVHSKDEVSSCNLTNHSLLVYNYTVLLRAMYIATYNK